jgi:hypothetical protein
MARYTVCELVEEVTKDETEANRRWSALVARESSSFAIGAQALGRHPECEIATVMLLSRITRLADPCQIFLRDSVWDHLSFTHPPGDRPLDRA